MDKKISFQIKETNFILNNCSNDHSICLPEDGNKGFLFAQKWSQHLSQTHKSKNPTHTTPPNPDFDHVYFRKLKSQEIFFFANAHSPEFNAKTIIQDLLDSGVNLMPKQQTLLFLGLDKNLKKMLFSIDLLRKFEITLTFRRFFHVPVIMINLTQPINLTQTKFVFRDLRKINKTRLDGLLDLEDLAQPAQPVAKREIMTAISHFLLLEQILMQDYYENLFLRVDAHKKGQYTLAFGVYNIFKPGSMHDKIMMFLAPPIHNGKPVYRKSRAIREFAPQVNHKKFVLAKYYPQSKFLVWKSLWICDIRILTGTGAGNSLNGVMGMLKSNFIDDASIG